MRYAYPINLIPQEDGNLLVKFSDVPEALTEGATHEEALAEATDALLAALGGYINDRRAVPLPSEPANGQAVVRLPPLAAAKLALYQVMREEGVTNVELGRRLRISEGAVRRLLDLDHRSHIGQVEAALKILGRQLVVSVEAA